MNNKKLLLIVLVVFGLVILFIWQRPLSSPPSINDGQGHAVSSSEFNQNVANKTWILTAMEIDGINTKFENEKGFTLKFDSSKISYSGFGACNGFGGQYEESLPNKFKLGAAMGTMVGCDGNDLESKQGAAFMKIEQLYLDGQGNLILQSKDQKTILRYKLQP